MSEPTTTLVDLLEQFAAHAAATGKSPNTVKAYVSDVRLFGRWFKQTNDQVLAPERITPIDIREYRSYLLTVRNYKPATVNRKLAGISAFCGWAGDVGLLTGDPTHGVSPVAEVRPAPKWLDKNEQYALLRAVQAKGRVRDIALVTLMLHTGLRVSEVSALRYGDLSMSARKGSVRVRGGKGGKYRTVLLNADARRALAVYLDERSIAAEDALFVGQRGGALQPPGIYHLVKRYAYDARLQDVTPHTLRHTFGKNLIDAGVSLDRVAQLLGHNSVDTTRIYTVPSEQDLQRDVERIAVT